MLLTTAVSVASTASLLSGCSAVNSAVGAVGGGDDTVTVMTWAPEDTQATNMPGMPAMAKAYARWVNEKGGINGRKLRVLTCNDHNDTVRAARCANRAKRQDVVAVVGSYSQYGRSFMPALESAGIPYIGGYGVTDQEYTSPYSYPVSGGLPALIAGNGRQLAAGGCSHVSLVRPDTTAGDQLPRLLNAGLAGSGAGPATDIRAPEDATAYARPARKALTAGAGSGLPDTQPQPAVRDGRDARGGKPCVTAVLGGRTNTFFDSFRQAGKEAGGSVRTASVLGSVRQSLVNQSGGPSSPLEGAFATGWYPVDSDPRWKPMRSVITQHAFGDNDVDATDPGVQTTWIAYTVLHKTLKGIGKEEDVTADAVREQLDQGGSIDTGGLTPKLNWNFDNMLAARDFPRIVNTTVTYQRVRFGQLTQVHEGFVDVRETLEDGASEL
jgi:ABC-type branched-subunit amino acid transport system substrate-binding protein